MRALCWLFILALLPGCWGPDRARELYQRALFEDSGGGELGQRESLHFGRRLERRVQKLEAQPQLTLADCFQLALHHSEELRLQGERLLETELLVPRAIAGIMPRVLFNAQYLQDSDEVSFGGSSFTPQERTNYYFTVRQPLLEGRLFPSLDLADALERIERLRLREARDQLLYAVATEFYQIKSLEKDLAVLAVSQERSDENLRILRAQRDVGETSRQEVLLMEARREQVRADHITTGQDLKQARSRLARLVGLNELDVQLEDTYQVKFHPGSLPRLVDEALAQRPEVEAARAAIEQAEAEADFIWTEYLPRINLEWTHWTEIEGGFQENLDWTLTLNGEWTLFDGGDREARLASAMSAIRQRQLELESRRKDVRQEVTEAVYGFMALDLSLPALESRARAAKASQELVNARVEAQEARVLDQLEALEAREQAVRDLERARLARKVAALRIRLAIGDLIRAEPVVEILREVQ